MAADCNGNGQVRAERQSYLREHFGFVCACALCRLQGAELDKSDARQRRVGDLFAEIRTAFQEAADEAREMARARRVAAAKEAAARSAPPTERGRGGGGKRRAAAAAAAAAGTAAGTAAAGTAVAGTAVAEAHPLTLAPRLVALVEERLALKAAEGMVELGDDAAAMAAFAKAIGDEAAAAAWAVRAACAARLALGSDSREYQLHAALGGLEAVERAVGLRGAPVARVADALRQHCHATLDGFLAPEVAAGINELLRRMHARGELALGEVSAGVRERTRNDLMRWLTSADERSPALSGLFAALDDLVNALARHESLRDEWGGGRRLVRAETQCTCYPGGGARYTRHTDDAKQRVRRLTCILYANPRWAEDAGGELRLHLADGTGRERMVDVAPLDNRLVLFFSDARVPHEVLPTYAPRYAVSVWYHRAA